MQSGPTGIHVPGYISIRSLTANAMGFRTISPIYIASISSPYLAVPAIGLGYVARVSASPAR